MIKDPGICRHFRAWLLYSAGLLFGLSPAVFWACSPTCETDLDCDATDALTQCVEGACEEIPVDPGQSCTVAEDCKAEEGTFDCIEGTCGQKPRCQQVVGEFSYFLLCEDQASARGTATLTAEDCQVDIQFSDVSLLDPPLAFSIQLSEIPSVFASAEMGLGESSDSICAGGKWVASTSSLALLDCVPPGYSSICKVGLIPNLSLRPPCLLDDADESSGCDGDASCEAGLGSDTVGLCQ